MRRASSERLMRAKHSECRAESIIAQLGEEIVRAALDDFVV
jgi:hypothetical protein